MTQAQRHEEQRGKLYDDLNPLEARIQSGSGTAALWTWTLVTGILGLAFLLAAVLAWFMGR